MSGGEAVVVPSGMTVTLIDVISGAPGPDGAVVRFRFLAPDIATGVEFPSAAADMEFLCRTYALPRVQDNVPAPTQIIVSLSDRAVTFGEADDDATQFFEAYRIEDGDCVWDAF